MTGRTAKRDLPRAAPRRIAPLALALTALLPLAASAQAAGQPQLTTKTVNVQNAGALGAFHRALAALEAGKRARVRVYHFGDSHVAGDSWSGYTRRLLQQRFGDGGPGYLLPYPHGSLNESPVSIKAGPGFTTRRHGYAKAFGPPDGLWGLAGAAMEGRGAGAWLELRTASYGDGSTFELHLLGQSPGNKVAVVIDSRTPDLVDTTHPAQGLVRQLWPLAPGAHVIKAQVLGPQPVRVLGAVLERNGPGVVYDTLGINGHRVTAINLWNASLLASEFRQRPPDLIVLSYGNNEGLSNDLTLEAYERELRKAVTALRRLAPQASLLLTGPVAMCPEPPKVTKVSEIQRRVAPEYGAAFWDTAQVSGGPGSLCSWIAADRSLVSPDHLHLRKRGYQLIAAEFAKAILRGYPPR